MEFVSKYANLLNPNDSIELFSLLEKKLGSRTAAAMACGLTRKTAYDWHEAKDLKFDTKVKLLGVLIEKLPDETLEYLTSISVDSASDILMVYLSAVYESALRTTERESFFRKLAQFDEIRDKYAGLIAGRFDMEVSNYILYLKQKTKEFHLEWMPIPSPVITMDQASILIPMIIREILKKNVADKTIGYEFGVSESLVSSIRTVLQQTLSLSGVIPSDLRRQMGVLGRTLTSIADPLPDSVELESSNIITPTFISTNSQEKYMQ
ncbi:MAG: hypothetical protein KGI11_09235 [Thaumarchaeota archaeon]|nr:hypothetical protein [Nitrososphaerota archaeon]